jgi:hypothetical protein
MIGILSANVVNPAKLRKQGRPLSLRCLAVDAATTEMPSEAVTPLGIERPTISA